MSEEKDPLLCTTDELRLVAGALTDAVDEVCNLALRARHGVEVARSDVRKLLQPVVEEAASLAPSPADYVTIRNEGAAIRLQQALTREAQTRWPGGNTLYFDDFEMTPTPGSRYAIDLKLQPNVKAQFGAAAFAALLDFARAYALALAEYPL